MFKKITQTLLIATLFFAGLHIPHFTNVEYVNADSIDRAEEELREQLAELEEQAAILEASLNEQKNKSATIERDVNILADEINRAELKIRQKNLEIQELSKTINLKEQTINELDEKMERSRGDLALMIRKTNQADLVSLPEIILGSRSLSEFFLEYDQYKMTQVQLENLFEDIREIKNQTEAEKEGLEIAQDEEYNAKYTIESQKQTVEVKKNQQDNLLALSKQSEATYASVLAERRAEASAIRTALFQLRDTSGIPFGEALEYAYEAERATGVRAAYILAVLKQESDLGKNVGTCNRPGDPENKRWHTIMPGPTHYANYVANGYSCSGAASPCSWRDDQSIFKDIASSLGLDYKTTPLSCPIASVGGWGGAMGPSQFIPSTWSSFADRIADVVGVSIANPWDPEHAIVATSLYLQELGAAGGSYSNEHTAAAKYYAGSNYAGGPGQSYGNSVMSHTIGIQQQIDFLEDVAND
jgi:membrane-bound lytic murein transglycosylase B